MATTLKICAFSLVVASVAHAQDRAAADTLFEEGRKLMEAGDYATACQKLSSSMQLMPRLGTQLNLADCEEKQGKLASAWTDFRAASARAKQEKDDDREALARERASKLEPRLPRITISLANGARGTVKRDGQTVPPAVYGTAVPVDSGEHTIALDGTSWSRTISVQEGETQAVEVPALAAPPTSRGGGQRIAGLAVGAAGVIALGVGVGIGLAAVSSYHDGIAQCTSDFRCPPLAKKQVNDAFAGANVSTILVVACGAAIAR
jgi:serine/threonine-protein kinase